MIFHSIRWRILAWNFALLAATATVLLVAFYRHERQNRLQEADLKVRQFMTQTMGAMGELVPGLGGPRGAADARPPPTVRLRAGDTPAQRKLKAEQAVQLLAKEGAWCLGALGDGKVTFRSSAAPEDDTLMPLCVEELRVEDETPSPGRPLDVVLSHRGQRVLIHRPPGQNFAVFGLNMADTEKYLNGLAWRLTFAGLGVIVIGCSIGWVLAGRSLRPIDRIASTAEAIADGDYGRQIDIAGTENELERLAAVLNGTFAKMNAARDRVTQFTADASHELRTPLTVILSDSQGALRHERTPEEYRTALETIKQSALRMKAISDGLLELAHGDAGAPPPQDDCDLADLADESVALLARLAKEHGAHLVAKLEGAPVKGDAGRLGRVVLNLVINAILHNEAGVTVTVTTGVEGAFACLTIVDDGRGISPENLDKIFERFRRVDSMRSRHTGGAGLGLAIVKQTVEAHGGNITVESQVAHGTTFRIKLPAAIVT
jgi:signal transduction histidine kinase